MSNLARLCLIGGASHHPKHHKEQCFCLECRSHKVHCHQGPTGSTGATGPTGPSGVTGATGATGPAGAASVITYSGLVNNTLTTSMFGSVGFATFEQSNTTINSNPENYVFFRIPRGGTLQNLTFALVVPETGNYTGTVTAQIYTASSPVAPALPIFVPSTLLTTLVFTGVNHEFRQNNNAISTVSVAANDYIALIVTGSANIPTMSHVYGGVEIV